MHVAMMVRQTSQRFEAAFEAAWGLIRAKLQLRRARGTVCVNLAVSAKI
jgi:hypothetical protein